MVLIGGEKRRDEEGGLWIGFEGVGREEGLKSRKKETLVLNPDLRERRELSGSSR